MSFESSHEKSKKFGSRPGLNTLPAYTVIKADQKLEIRIEEEKGFAISVSKTKALISFAVTMKVVCAFVFAYLDLWFSGVAAHLS